MDIREAITHLHHDLMELKWPGETRIAFNILAFYVQNTVVEHEQKQERRIARKLRRDSRPAKEVLPAGQTDKEMAALLCHLISEKGGTNFKSETRERIAQEIGEARRVLRIPEDEIFRALDIYRKKNPEKVDWHTYFRAPKTIGRLFGNFVLAMEEHEKKKSPPEMKGVLTSKEAMSV
jgi:hypothetical protein